MRLFIVPFAMFIMPASAISQEANTPEVSRLIEAFAVHEKPKWTYESLAADSDLVVIANVVETNIASSEVAIKSDIDGESVQRFCHNLEVLSVLKGNVEDEICVITTNWKPNVLVSLNADLANLLTRKLLPNLCAVEIDGKIVDWTILRNQVRHEITPEYLLYLKETDQKGTFVPTTGQRWSAASVRLLND